ncbi:MAG: ral secretion pathway protein [Burkholderiales bacterium]
MYIDYFNLTQAPFSIAPDPRYLFMTHGHREALAHLLYGVNSGGGLVMLTGEIGAGKTTVCRYFLEQVPANCNVAYIFNPKMTVKELLQSICDEFRISFTYEGRNAASVKAYVDALNRYLLDSHAEGQNNVLIIDEAQNLSAEVLEQLRLLTNLETNERKLLQIIMIGQPELRGMLDRPELQQLAQRVIARYHLNALTELETAAYIQHRLSVSGSTGAPPFDRRAMAQIHHLAQGVPRRINLLCDRALLGAYAKDKRKADRAMIDKAATEVFGIPEAAPKAQPPRPRLKLSGKASLAASALVVLAIIWTLGSFMQGLDARRPIAATVMPDVTENADKMIKPAAVTTTAPARKIFSEVDGTSSHGLENRNVAYQQLAKLWGVNLPLGEPCVAARDQNLHCYRSEGGFAELRQLDRPALVTLHDRAGGTYHAVLTGLSDSTVTLSAGEATQTVSLLVLSRYFQGDFTTLWQAPWLYRGHVEFGDKGPEVDWIAAQLATLSGEKAPGENQVYDEKMVKRVREFQATRGIKADGMVGQLTFMHLNRVAGLDEPRLKNSHTATIKATE